MSAPHRRAAAIAAAARACVGARFRPQGRDIATGLDCAGVVLAAAQAIGCSVPACEPYALQADGLTERLRAGLFDGGFTLRSPSECAVGDVALFEVATDRPHLAISTGLAVVHAHAGLRRVVEGPVDPAWRLLGWYLFPVAE